MVLNGQLSITDLLRAMPAPSPAEEPARELKPLTLEELGGLEPFRTEVWIEERPWATQQVTKDSEVYKFFLLFKALFTTIGIPIGSERRHYHFSYTYTDGRRYDHFRVDEFYGREWRVWREKPTDEEREAVPWQRSSGSLTGLDA